MWYTIYTCKRVKPNAQRDSNYLPWVRNDYHNWSYLQALFTNLLTLPRIAGCWMGILFGLSYSTLLDIGHDKTQPYTGWRLKVLEFILPYNVRAVVLCGGCVWSTCRRVQVDYSHWLGPDYVYRYDKVGIHVCNHTSPLDF